MKTASVVDGSVFYRVSGRFISNANVLDSAAEILCTCMVQTDTNVSVAFWELGLLLMCIPHEWTAGPEDISRSAGCHSCGNPVRMKCRPRISGDILGAHGRR